MRRLSLPVGVALAMLSLAPIATATSSAGAASGPVRADRSAARAAPVAPTAPVAPALPAGIPDEIDLLTAVPALQSALGDRYGGYWIDTRAGREVMHVAVVGATGADRATVARMTGGHPAVRTVSVRHGYDDLLAAQEEIAVSMQGRGTDFTVDVDVATNRVVVSTESADARTTAATAQGAARRGVERRTVQRAPARTGAAGARPAPPGDRMPAADVGAAVAIEPNARIEVAPSTRDRWTYPPYEAGLAVTTAVGSTRYLCTSGFLFRSSAIGYFASTAGHCGPIGSPTWIGRLRADSIRHNGYYSSRQVTADASLIYRGAAWVPWPVIHSVTHPSVAGQFSNAQLANGLSLCFEGMTSDNRNCGAVVRANQWLCCDATGRSFHFTCINYPSGPGDSGGPVYRVFSGNRAAAAGLVSSSVTINGARLTCFTSIENITRRLGVRLVVV